jgi:hypothetical protein
MASPESHETEEPARIDALELAQRLGSIAKIRRTLGNDPETIDQWKQRFRDQGFDGLSEVTDETQATVVASTAGVTGRIIALAIDNPANGCQRISEVLTETGFPISHVSVQTILNRNGLGHRNARIQEIERRVLDGTIPETPQRTEWITSVNPAFAERGHDPDRPWHTISIGHAVISRIPGLGRLHLHVAVDCWSQTAYAVAAPDNQPEWPVSILHNDALPMAKSLGLTVQTIRTDQSSTYHGPQVHLFTLYLELNDISHERREQQDGHARRFIAILLEDFVKKTRKRNYATLARYQFELDSWTAVYNKHRELQGWPNMGLAPVQRIQSWQEAQKSPGTNRTPRR